MMMNVVGFYIKTLSLVALVMYVSCGNASQKISAGAKTADRPSKESAPMRYPEHEKNFPDGSENHAMRWYPSKIPHETKGVALVIHGLNLRPAKMESIISRLTNARIGALNVSLQGHGENYSNPHNKDHLKARLNSFKKASYHTWMQEICDAYRAVRHRSDRQRVPLFLIGFSLGGLLGTDLLVTEPGVQFDKMVLFAPALKMHWRNYIIRVLSPFPGLIIPSFAMKSYLSNNGTPMAAYNALFESLNSVEANVGPKANIPTLVFMDTKDEIVSYRRLKKMVAEHELDQWEFYIVQKEISKGPARMHHLIIDPLSTGKDVWKEMMAVMITHLME